MTFIVIKVTHYFINYIKFVIIKQFYYFLIIIHILFLIYISQFNMSQLYQTTYQHTGKSTHKIHVDPMYFCTKNIFKQQNQHHSSSKSNNIQVQYIHINRVGNIPKQGYIFTTPKQLIIYNIIISCVSIAMPFLIKQIFKDLENNKLNFDKIFYFIALSLFSVFLNSIYNWRSNQFQYGFRILVSQRLMQKQLTTVNQQSMEVWNHIINDAHQFTHFYKSVCLTYGQSLKFFFALGYLFTQMGLKVLFIALGVAAVLSFLNGWISKKGQQVYAKRMKNYVRKLDQMKFFINSLTEIKMCGLQTFYHKKLTQLRKQQLVTLKQKYFFQYLFNLIEQIVLILISTGFFLSSYTLQPSEIQNQPNKFIMIYLIDLVRGPLSSLPTILLGFRMAKYSQKKLQKFLTQKSKIIKRNTQKIENKNNAIQVKSGYITGHQGFRLQIPQTGIIIEKGKLYTLIGDSGSGKSLFIKSIFNLVENNINVKINSSIGYVQDKPFHLKNALNAIYNNPRVGLKFQKQKQIDLFQILHRFHCLQIPFKHQTINYSGGEKLRLALARAFHNFEIIIIDCSLNCLDKKVKEYVINGLIQQCKQKQKTIIVINDYGLSQNILKIQKGILRKEVVCRRENEDKIFNSQKDLQIYKQKYFENTCLQHNLDKQVSKINLLQLFTVSTSISTIPVVIPKLSLSTYLLYYQKPLPHILFVSSILIVSIIQYKYNILTTQNHLTQTFFKDIIILTILTIIFWFARIFTFVWSNYIQIKRIVQSIIKTITMSPLSFYQNKTSQQIIGRYTADSNLIDYAYPTLSSNIISYFINFIFMIFIVISKLSLIMMIPLTISIFYIYTLQKYYRRINNTLQSLEKDYSTQFYDVIQATIRGKSLILAHSDQIKYKNELFLRMKHYVNILLGMKVLDRWIIMRLDILTVVLLGSLLVMAKYGLQNGKLIIGSATISLGIRYVMSITNNMKNLTFMYSKVQRISVSLKRLEEYIIKHQNVQIQFNKNINRVKKQKQNYQLFKNSKSNQIRSPQINLQNVHFKYSQQGPLIFQNLNLNVKSKQRILIRGKTGSGKTTLFKILTGLYKKQVPVNQNIISFSPQKPLIISQNLMQNLDPYGIVPSEQLQNIIKQRLVQVEDKNIKTTQLAYNEQLKLNGLRAQIYGRGKIILYDEPQQVQDGKGCIIVSHHKQFKSVQRRYELMGGRLVQLRWI